MELAMHRLQTMMGEIQDMAVLLVTLDRFLKKKQLADEDFAPLRAELFRRRQHLIEACMQSLDKLDRFWPLPKTERA